MSPVTDKCLSVIHNDLSKWSKSSTIGIDVTGILPEDAGDIDSKCIDFYWKYVDAYQFKFTNSYLNDYFSCCDCNCCILMHNVLDQAYKMATIVNYYF